jgi:hypothetical protein
MDRPSTKILLIHDFSEYNQQVNTGKYEQSGYAVQISRMPDSGSILIFPDGSD